ncbi:hypothetical protein AB0K43_12930 [Kitasatospora sp. NPDC049258]|uniref:hypothetical protein n=1 Tax=Kitasatospora sp. NPDC049258 TaxID=3155394 RepID=UPI003439A1DF
MLLNAALGTPDDSGRLLADMGLRPEYFDRAVRIGERSREQCTNDDAKNARGTQDYLTRVRELRFLLRTELGWKRYDPKQAPLIVNPDKTIAIGVLLGDARTGLPGNPQPRSHRPAGITKEAAVARNQSLQQLSLFTPTTGPDDEVQLDDDEYANLATWYLLTHRFEGKKSNIVEIRSELSLPDRIGPKGRIDSWRARILLPPVRIEEIQDYTGDHAASYVVDVQER